MANRIVCSGTALFDKGCERKLCQKISHKTLKRRLTKWVDISSRFKLKLCKIKFDAHIVHNNESDFARKSYLETHGW